VVRPGAEHKRLVEAALEEFCRAVRQVNLYSENHPIAAAAVHDAAETLRSLLSGGTPLEIRVSREGLEANGETLDLRRTGLGHFHQQLHGHSIRALELRPGVQAPEIKALIAVLNADPAYLADQGGAGGQFSRAQAPHIRLDQYDYRRLVRESEARWLAMFSGAAEARSSVVEELVGTSLSAVGDVDALLRAAQERGVPAADVAVRPVPQWVAAAEEMAAGRRESQPTGGVVVEADPVQTSPEDYLARSLAVLLQTAWESLSGRDYSERVRWRNEVGRLVGLLTPEMRARLFRAEFAPGPGHTDVLVELARAATADEAVELVMAHPEAVINEPSAALESVLRRVMGDESRLLKVEPLLRQRLMARGVSEETYRSVVGLLLDHVAKDRALARPDLDGHMKVITAAATLGGEAPGMDDLLTTVAVPAARVARREILLEILRQRLDPSQSAKAVERVGAELARCGEAGEAEAVFELAAALQRLADPASGLGSSLRTMATEALRRNGIREAVQCLTQILPSQAEERKLEVVRLLAQMEKSGGEALLRIAAGSYSPRVVAAALRAVAGSGKPVPEALKVVRAAPADQAEQIIAALVRGAGEGTATTVALFLEHRDEAVQRRAVARLGEVPGSTSQEILLRVMFDPNPSLRAAAAESLGKMAARGAVLALGVAANQGWLVGKAFEVRLAAVKALGQIGEAGCVAPLLKVLATRSPLLKRNSEALRLAAVEALARIPGEEAEMAVLSAARDRSQAVADAGWKAVQERRRASVPTGAGGEP